MTSQALSFYFFDFDKNIMKVQVPFVLVNTEDGSEMELSGAEYMDIRDNPRRIYSSEPRVDMFKWREYRALTAGRETSDDCPL